MMRIIFFNFLIFLIFLLIAEGVFGYWFSKENFGSYMRKERNKNWKTEVDFNNKKYSFFYKRNFYGFRGEEFEPKDVKIIFEGGSTGNQRFTPEHLTIVGLLNKKFSLENIDLKIFNASTDGKSLRGYINDFLYWFPNIKNFKPKYVIFYLGINERFAEEIKEETYDLHFQEKKIDRIKDYIKNNSFIYEKFIFIKNKYFPKNTNAYLLDNKNLYDQFTYIYYETANELHKNILDENYDFIKKSRIKLSVLKKIIVKNDIVPIFITQVLFDGLKDQKLFLFNEEIKKFVIENDYYIFNLDELIYMEKYDYYDEMHTTPKGSEKIANTIYPFLKDILIDKKERYNN